MPSLRVVIDMLEITKAIETSIGPKDPLNKWELRYAGTCQPGACLGAAEHTAMRQLPK